MTWFAIEEDDSRVGNRYAIVGRDEFHNSDYYNALRQGNSNPISIVESTSPCGSNASASVSTNGSIIWDCGITAPDGTFLESTPETFNPEMDEVSERSAADFMDENTGKFYAYTTSGGNSPPPANAVLIPLKNFEAFDIIDKIREGQDATEDIDRFFANSETPEPLQVKPTEQAQEEAQQTTNEKQGQALVIALLIFGGFLLMAK